MGEVDLETMAVGDVVFAAGGREAERCGGEDEWGGRLTNPSSGGGEDEWGEIEGEIETGEGGRLTNPSSGGGDECCASASKSSRILIRCSSRQAGRLEGVSKRLRSPCGTSKPAVLDLT